VDLSQALSRLNLMRSAAGTWDLTPQLLKLLSQKEHGGEAKLRLAAPKELGEVEWSTVLVLASSGAGVQLRMGSHT
jgi:hypothetical protein